MAGVPKQLSLAQIKQKLQSIPHIKDVAALRVWTVHGDQTALSAHLKITHMQYWPAIHQQCQDLLQQLYQISEITLQPEIPQLADCQHEVAEC